eukprot:1156843-Pelagomonas_calceolata.AAC.7
MAGFCGAQETIQPALVLPKKLLVSIMPMHLPMRGLVLTRFLRAGERVGKGKLELKDQLRWREHLILGYLDSMHPEECPPVAQHLAYRLRWDYRIEASEA